MSRRSISASSAPRSARACWCSRRTCRWACRCGRAADAMGWEPQGYAVQIAAVTAALAGAMLLTYTERRWPEVQEALIGVLFVLATYTSLLLLANNPHGGEHLKDLLVNQNHKKKKQQQLPVAALSALVLALWFG